MSKRYWVCRACGFRNTRDRTRHLRCAGCGEETKPKRRVTRHALTLRDDGYAAYVQAARDIHGVTDESCCVCGKPRSQERRHDRDHDHLTGKPRGLACPGNAGCNVLMPAYLTPAAAWAISESHADPKVCERFGLIAAYLERVEAYRAREVAS